MENKKNRLTTRDRVFTGVFLALGLVLPKIFHQFAMGGQVFLPMHIPTLICSLFLGPVCGLLVGIFSPILSSILTGMPPVMPMLPIMTFELAGYGFMAGYLYKKRKMGIYPSLILAMAFGRVIAGLIAYVLASRFKVEIAGPVAFVWGGIITGLPGIIIQLAFVPLLVRLLEKNIK